jgi:hypothetical protein
MASDERKKGKPRTDEERKRRHKKLYGTDKLPPRGTGLINSQAKFERMRVKQGAKRY